MSLILEVKKIIYSSVSHSRKCRGSVTGLGSPQVSVASTQAVLRRGNSNVVGPDAPLSSFEEVCQLHCATVRHIPQKARPSFARVLSDTLRFICLMNSEEAWLNFSCCQSVYCEPLIGVVVSTSLCPLKSLASCGLMAT